MEKYFISALIWWSIWGIFSLVVYYYNLKKERFFRLQEKWEYFLNTLYEYQNISLEIDGVNMKKTYSLASELEKYNKEENNLWIQKTRLEEKIFSIIYIYFPEIEENFLTYLSIKNNEYTWEKEILNKISKSLVNNINSKRRIFFLFKI